MKQPRFWFQPPNMRARILTPLSWLYTTLGRRRAQRTKAYRSKLPVICVGNINIGGTGKTPVVIALIERLLAAGRKPVVLSRGYGGALKGPVLVTARHSAADVGDEPKLLSAFAEVVVSADRAAGAQMIEAMDADCIIMDDGMQNPSLAKDLTVWVIDGGIGFGNGMIFPAGPLRETPAEGTERSDLAIVIGGEAPKGIGDLPVLKASLKPLKTGIEWGAMRVVAFAGIGRPEKFFDSLRAEGATLIETHAFSDHAPYARPLLERLKRDAWAKDAQLVTTEKDAARLPESFRLEVMTFPVRLQIETPDPLDQALQQLFHPSA